MSKTRAEIRAQYPANEAADQAIAAKLEVASNADKRIACRAVHDIANEIKCSPSKVGQTADLIEVRINRCQLGLFGRKDSNIQLLSKGDISQEISTVIEAAVSNGKIACLVCWQIADKLNLSRLEMGAVCDALEVKVSPCQLGAF